MNASQLAQDLKNNPTSKNVAKVTSKLLNTKNNNNELISESIVMEIVEMIEDEVGDLQMLNEQFDNREQIKVMQQMHKLMDQANKAKAQSIQTSTRSSQTTGGRK